MTSKEPYTAAAGQVRKATEQSAEAWKEGTKKLLDQVGTIPAMPRVDLNQPVEQYFDFVQRTVDLNRELATRWAELVNTLSGGARERAESFSRIVKDQADTLAGMAAQQAQKTEQVARDQAEQAGQARREQEREAEEAVKAQAREAKRIEREQARKAEQEAEEAEEAEKAKAREAKRIERGRSQEGSGEGPRSLRGSDQGGTVRSAVRAWPAEDGQPRGPHRAARERRQRVILDAFLRRRCSAGPSC